MLVTVPGGVLEREPARVHHGQPMATTTAAAPAGADLFRAEGLTVLAFAPARLGLYLEPIPGQLGHAVPLTAAEVLARHPKAVAVLNGPMFGTCASEHRYPTQVETYRRSRCSVIDFQHFDAQDVPLSVGRRPGDGVTLAVTADGRAVMEPDNDVPPGAVVAVQLYPVMVRGGTARGPFANTSSNNSVVWRSAVGILRDGRVALAAGQASLHEFARKLWRAGFVEAGYTDGGGSTSLLVRGATRVGHPENRRVPSWLVFEQDPGDKSGISTGLATALAVFGTAGFGYWLTTRKVARSARRR